MHRDIRRVRHHAGMRPLSSMVTLPGRPTPVTPAGYGGRRAPTAILARPLTTTIDSKR